MREATFDILIPTAGPVEDIFKCLSSVKEHSEDYRVLWLSNGAPYELKCAVKMALQGMPHLALEVEKNLGSAKGHNILLAYSTAPYIVILNDDVEVVPKWLPNVQRLLEIEKVGMAAPCVDNGRHHQSAKDEGAPKNGELLDVPIIATYCAMLSRDCLNQVGYFSEEYYSGWDIDYSHRVRKKGFRLAIDLRTVCKHRWHATVDTFPSSERTVGYNNDMALLRKYR